jgi:hypothetical protein
VISRNISFIVGEHHNDLDLAITQHLEARLCSASNSTGIRSEAEQIYQLFDSLMQGFPVGSFLFSSGTPAGRPFWVDDFLGSETLAEQMAILGGRLEASRVADAIGALRSRNGVLMKTALAQKLGIPAFRIDGFLSNLQRVLNVDGYPVISVDASHTVPSMWSC